MVPLSIDGKAAPDDEDPEYDGSNTTYFVSLGKGLKLWPTEAVPLQEISAVLRGAVEEGGFSSSPEKIQASLRAKLDNRDQMQDVQDALTRKDAPGLEEQDNDAQDVFVNLYCDDGACRARRVLSRVAAYGKQEELATLGNQRLSELEPVRRYLTESKTAFHIANGTQKDHNLNLTFRESATDSGVSWAELQAASQKCAEITKSIAAGEMRGDDGKVTQECREEIDRQLERAQSLEGVLIFTESTPSGEYFPFEALVPLLEDEAGGNENVKWLLQDNETGPGKRTTLKRLQNALRRETGEGRLFTYFWGCRVAKDLFTHIRGLFSLAAPEKRFDPDRANESEQELLATAAFLFSNSDSAKPDIKRPDQGVVDPAEQRAFLADLPYFRLIDLLANYEEERAEENENDLRSLERVLETAERLVKEAFRRSGETLQESLESDGSSVFSKDNLRKIATQARGKLNDVMHKWSDNCLFQRFVAELKEGCKPKRADALSEKLKKLFEEAEELKHEKQCHGDVGLD
jgi:hypothetical protein